MQNALIYSPSFEGHRQVNTFVLIDILLKLGYQVSIAGSRELGIGGEERPYIKYYDKTPGVIFIDTSKWKRGGYEIDISNLIELQTQCKADVTLLPEADFFKDLILSQIVDKKKALRGHVVGTFLYPFYIYARPNLIKRLRRIKHLKETWKKDDKLFHEFFLRWFSLLDKSLTFDENYIKRNSHFDWIPDSFQLYADSRYRPSTYQREHWEPLLSNFLKNKSGEFVLLYFGTAQPRRGYDTMLKLAVDEGCRVVHCGLDDKGAVFDFEIENLKNTLRKRGDLFETNQYIDDPSCIDMFFQITDRMIFPYRNFPGSSAVMIQAINYGMPVLVPRFGLMGLRVERNGIGKTYTLNNYEELKNIFRDFRNSPLSNFKDKINIYKDYYLPGQIENTIILSITGQGNKIATPPI